MELKEMTLQDVEARLSAIDGEIEAATEVDAVNALAEEKRSLLDRQAELKDLAERVTKNYDIVIFDFPAGMDFTLYQSLGKDTQFLTVCNPDPVSVRDAGAVCNNIPSSLKAPRLIINRFNIEYIKSGMYSNIDDIIDISGFRLLGIVPQSDELMMLPVFHKLKKRGQAQKALTRIAKRLLGEEIKLPRLKKI